MVTSNAHVVEVALKDLRKAPIGAGAKALFAALGYKSPKTVKLDGSPEDFLSKFDPDRKLEQVSYRASLDCWKRVEFIFQLTNDELPMLAQSQLNWLSTESSYHRSIIESFVFLAIELEDAEWPRGRLADITRGINRLFPMPVIVVFRYSGKLTIAAIPRRAHKRDSSRDVVEKSGKVALIKDVDLASPHRAHIDIVANLHLHAKTAKKTPSTFNELYAAWTEVLSAEELNKRFYKNLSNWYLWAKSRVDFPVARGVSKDEADSLNQVSVIRLLTRLIFIWFIKEKKLVPDDLFDRDELKSLLKLDPTSNLEASNFYLSVLQNLFFATLNTQMGSERKWRSGGAKSGRTSDYLVTTLYRHKDSFSDADQALELFRSVPFLNGGLFECLDREITEDDISHGRVDPRHLTKEGNQKVFRGDGFSERSESQPVVPNEIFFGAEIDAKELNKEYGTKGKKYRVDGLLAIFERYRFTVEENTPLDEEVALDPELLGKVFENLIASYNEDTRTSARKLSGSFYTPKVVVEYMVDEALVGYLTPVLQGLARSDDGRGTKAQARVSESLNLGPAPGELGIKAPNGERVAPEKSDGRSEARIRELLDTHTEDLDFSDDERKRLIDAIENLRAIDPACGSGAFPMGLLAKLVHVLQRLDPDNVLWEQSVRAPLQRQLEEAKNLRDASRRNEAIEHAEDELRKLDHDFSANVNYADFSRKLYIIDKCIHGVDIQPIAVQIAKLRFFISLVVSQKIDPNADNYNITPLPNLETRLVAANALIPIQRPKIVDMFRSEEITKIENDLKQANERYFGTRTRKSKNKARDDISALRDKLTDALTDTLDLPEDEARKIGRWDPFNQNASAEFFDPEWMFGLDQKFNIVIANPPYVRQEKIDKSQKQFFKASHDALKKAKGNRENFLPPGLYQSFSGTADYLVYFMERGLDLLAPGGMFIFITSNKWYRAAYGKNLRLWMNRASKIRSIIDFGDAEVFDAIAYPTILVTEKRASPVNQADRNETFKAWNWPDEFTKEEIDDFRLLFEKHSFQVSQKSLDNDKGWSLEDHTSLQVFSELERNTEPLRDYLKDRVYRGVTTGLNRAFVIDQSTRDEIERINSNDVQLIKPYITGDDLNRWQSSPSGQWIIFSRRGTNIEDYPSIKRHLSAFKKQLAPKPKDWSGSNWQGRKSGSYDWHELQDTVAYWEVFERDKILSTKISKAPTFSVDRDKVYPANTAYCLGANGKLHFLVTLLNSTVSDFYCRKIFATKRGGYFEIQPEGLESFPIPKASEEFVNLLEKMPLPAIAERFPKFEQILNGIVYELYFPDSLHANGIRFLEAVQRAGFNELVLANADDHYKVAGSFIERVFDTSHEVYRMLFDLRAVDEVRLIEGNF